MRSRLRGEGPLPLLSPAEAAPVRSRPSPHVKWGALLHPAARPASPRRRCRGPTGRSRGRTCTLRSPAAAQSWGCRTQSRCRRCWSRRCSRGPGRRCTTRWRHRTSSPGGTTTRCSLQAGAAAAGRWGQPAVGSAHVPASQEARARRQVAQPAARCQPRTRGVGGGALGVAGQAGLALQIEAGLAGGGLAAHGVRGGAGGVALRRSKWGALAGVSGGQEGAGAGRPAVGLCGAGRATPLPGPLTLPPRRPSQAAALTVWHRFRVVLSWKPGLHVVQVPRLRHVAQFVSTHVEHVARLTREKPGRHSAHSLTLVAQEAQLVTRHLSQVLPRLAKPGLQVCRRPARDREEITSLVRCFCFCAYETARGQKQGAVEGRRRARRGVGGSSGAAGTRPRPPPQPAPLGHSHRTSGRWGRSRTRTSSWGTAVGGAGQGRGL